MDEQLKKVDRNSVKSILDVGCGEGSKTYFLKTRFNEANVLGIDFSKSGINAAEKWKNMSGQSTGLDFLCVDADDLPVWEKKYDMVSCFEVLEHIDDWRSLAKKMALNSNKYIMLSFPSGKMKKSELKVGHVRNFKKGEVEEYLAKYSFYPVKVYYAGFPFLNPIGVFIGELLSVFYVEKLVTENKPTILTKLYSNIFYFLFKYCSTKYRFGKQFLGLFSRQAIKNVPGN